MCTILDCATSGGVRIPRRFTDYRFEGPGRYTGGRMRVIEVFQPGTVPRARASPAAVGDDSPRLIAELAVAGANVSMAGDGRPAWLMP